MNTFLGNEKAIYNASRLNTIGIFHSMSMYNEKFGHEQNICSNQNAISIKMEEN